jgi:hypothetical protein
MKIDKEYKRTRERIKKAVKSTFGEYFKKMKLICDSEEFEELSGVCFFDNKYDYILIELKYDETTSIFKYMEEIHSALVHNKFTTHIASSGEILVSNLIKKYHCKKMCIVQGTLSSADSTDTVSLSYLKSIEFSKDEKIITLIEEDRVYEAKSIVDFGSETITFIEGKDVGNISDM